QFCTTEPSQLAPELPSVQMRYSPPPPAIEVATLPVIPVIWTMFDEISVFSATSVWSVKLRLVGVVSWPSVVTSHWSLPVPIVTVALFIVLNDALLVRRTSRLWPLVIVVGPAVHDPPFTRTCG